MGMGLCPAAPGPAQGSPSPGMDLVGNEATGAWNCSHLKKLLENFNPV